MDMTNMNHNYRFYTGYDGKPEVLLGIQGSSVPVLHVWKGYLEDIFEKPFDVEEGAKGFTRDYIEETGVFAPQVKGDIHIEPQEYAADLLAHSEQKFTYPDTLKVLNALYTLLLEAASFGMSVTIEVR